jgi:hypothetical protein
VFKSISCSRATEQSHSSGFAKIQCVFRIGRPDPPVKSISAQILNRT